MKTNYCNICGKDFDQNRSNISPLEEYPICEECFKNNKITCEFCDDNHEVFYCKEIDRLLCWDCFLRKMEKIGLIKSKTVYYNNDNVWIGDSEDKEELIRYFTEKYNLRKL